MKPTHTHIIATFKINRFTRWYRIRQLRKFCEKHDITLEITEDKYLWHSNYRIIFYGTFGYSWNIYLWIHRLSYSCGFSVTFFDSAGELEAVLGSELLYS